MANEKAPETKKKIAEQPVPFRPRPDNHPVRNCLAVTVVAAACAVYAYYMKAPLVMVLGLLPAAAYETYRAWGPLTKFAAWLFLAVLAVEVILVFKKINIDLVRLSGPASGRIAGYNLPLTDIKVAGLLLLAVLSLILVIRTVGPYTKWLAADIVAGCLYAVYLLSPKHFGALIHWASHGVSNFVHHLMH